MSDIHIDDFYKDVGRILLQLYRTFPRKGLLLIEEVIGPDEPDEYGLHSVRHQSCFGAALWLAESGYLTYTDTIRQEGLDQVSLTHKAFTLLASPADWLQPGEPDMNEPCPASLLTARKSNIHQLREAIRSGASVNISRVVLALMMQSHQH